MLFSNIFLCKYFCGIKIKLTKLKIKKILEYKKVLMQNIKIFVQYEFRELILEAKIKFSI